MMCPIQLPASPAVLLTAVKIVAVSMLAVHQMKIKVLMDHVFVTFGVIIRVIAALMCSMCKTA